MVNGAAALLHMFLGRVCLLARNDAFLHFFYPDCSKVTKNVAFALFAHTVIAVRQTECPKERDKKVSQRVSNCGNGTD